MGKGQVRGQGWAERAHLAEKRFVGHDRRLRRGEVPFDAVGEEPFWTVREVVELQRGTEHRPVNAAPRYDTEGFRLFEAVAEVCDTCSDFEAGRLVPVSWCPLALAAWKVEEEKLWTRW